MSASVGCAEFFLSQTCGIEHEYWLCVPWRAEVGDVAIFYDCLYFLLFTNSGRRFGAFARIMSAAGLKVMLPRLREPSVECPQTLCFLLKVTGESSLCHRAEPCRMSAVSG